MRLNVSSSVVALACLLMAAPVVAQQPKKPKAAAGRPRAVRPVGAKAAAKAAAKGVAKGAAKPVAGSAIDRVKADLEKLKTEVEGSRRELVQVPVAMTALDQLAAEVSAMRGAVERLAAMRTTEGDVRRELDAVRIQLDEARAQIAQLRARVDQPGPEYPLPGGIGRDQRGFYLRTDDSTFELRLSGYLQVGYEGAYRSTGAAEAPGTYDQWRNLSAFALRRAKLRVSGFVLRPEISYSVELDLAKIYQRDDLVWHGQSGRLQTLRSPLEDVWGEVAFRRWLVARVGQFRVPFGREPQLHESKLHLVDTSVVGRTFGLDRDLGVMVHGTCPRKRFGWQAAVMNGNGANHLHDTGDLLYVARVLGSPLGKVMMGSTDKGCACKPRLTLGVSFAYRRARLDGGFGGLGGLAGAAGAAGSLGQVLAPALDRVDIYQVGAELAARWKRFTLLGEYVWRRQSNLHDTVEVTFYPGRKFGADYWGAYGQAGFYAIKDKLEIAARYAFALPHGFGLSAWDQEQLPRAVHEATLGLNYFHVGHNAKVMLDGSYVVERGLAALGTSADGYPSYDRKSARVRLVVQLKF